ncbi:MAG: DUF5906 domain-containing protein [Bacteroidota bacterium]|jgi:hypothetical protein
MSNKTQEQPYSKNNLTDQQKQLYRELFVNRDDVYLVQKAGGDYKKIASPLTDSILFSDQTIGTYQLDRQSQIKYACLDFDLVKEIHAQKSSMTEDEWNTWLGKIRDYVKSAYDFIRGMNIACFPEFSGFKGYHILFFLENSTPAAEVRKWMRHLSALLPQRPSGIELEIFPKQDAISDDGYGNFFKFPLQRNLKSGEFAVFLDDAFEPIVGLPQIAYTTLIELPKLPEDRKTVAKAVKTVSTGSKPELSLSKLPEIEKNCEYLRKLFDRIRTERHLDHSERIWLANLLMPFGREVVHNHISGCSDYDRTYTDEQLDSIGGKPSLCSSSPMCAAEKCPLMQEMGKESPIAFAYKVKTREEIPFDKPWVFFNAKAQRHHYLYKGEQYGIPKEELKTLYSNFGLKPPKKQKILFPKFDPQDPWYVNLLDRSINYFEETEYLRIQRTAEVFDPSNDFGSIWRLLSNLIPVEDERNHFVNWLATIFNTRKKMRTSFVFKGAQGAGKNAFFQHVIAPLLGKAQCRIVKNEDLIERFNPWMKQAFFIAFDEVAHDNKSRNMLNSKLKALITDDKVTLNDKNDKAYEIENNMNCVFFSNEAVPLVVEQSDRRFTIVRTGGNLLKKDFFNGDSFFAEIKNELHTFAQFLRNYAFDESLANSVLDTPEKQHLVSAVMGRFEEFAARLKKNDAEWLINAQNTDFLVSKPPVDGKLSTSETRRLFNNIYPDKTVSTQKLKTELALYGIEVKTVNGIEHYIWESQGGKNEV